VSGACARLLAEARAHRQAGDYAAADAAARAGIDAPDEEHNHNQVLLS
jgi:hypothetical protein